MCLVPFMPSIQRATFPKINLEILVSLQEVFSTLTSPCQTIFDTQKKKIAQLSNFFYLLLQPGLIGSYLRV